MTMRLTRRSLLSRGGAMVALPFLSQFAARRAHAARPIRPKRLVVVHSHQGMVLNQWMPTGSGTSFTLSPILQPLSPFQDQLVVISGLDNAIPSFNSSGNGHQNADSSVLTCQPFQTQGAATLVPNGPSVEHVLAQRISHTRPFLRLDFGIGQGNWDGQEPSAVMWAGAGDPVTCTTDPARMLTAVFGTGGGSEDALARLRARRGSVLDLVKQNFSHLRRQLDADDRARLDAHSDKIRELEQRVLAAPNTCARPVLSPPGGYDHVFDDDVSAPLQIELLVQALACGQTNVATLSFMSGHDPTFPWLNVNGGPVVPTGRYDNWHAMIHEGREEPGLVTGFTWYASQVAALLQRMAVVLDQDGDNLLESSLVLWTTEFGNGAGHNTYKLPIVLAGHLGQGIPMGRHLDFMVGTTEDNWTSSDNTTNQLFVSLLRAFGGTDTNFGHTHVSLPDGPLPGLLG